MARIFNSFLIVVVMGLCADAAYAQGRPIASLSAASTAEEGGWIDVIVTLDRPAPPLTEPVVQVTVEETIYAERHVSPVYFFPGDSESTYYFRVPEGETQIERTIRVPNNGHVDGDTEVTLIATPNSSVTISETAKTATVMIKDIDVEDVVGGILGDRVSIAMKTVKPFWYENEPYAELQVDIIEGEFINYDIHLTLVDHERSASDTNDYVDDGVDGTFTLEAGNRSQIIAKAKITNSKQLEDEEYFTVFIFRTGGSGDKFKIICHPDPFFIEECVKAEDRQFNTIHVEEVIKIIIKDDDIVSLSILSQDSPEIALAPTVYFAPGDNIKMYVTVDEETGDCIIPFPMTVDLRAHGDTNILSKSMEEGIRFPPCTAAKPNDAIGFLFPVKPAAELNPGIYDIDIMIEPQGTWDSRIYVRQSHWPVRVCVPGPDVDCSTFIAPPAPTLTTPPQVVPPVEEVGNTTPSTSSTSPGGGGGTSTGGGGGGGGGVVAVVAGPVHRTTYTATALRKPRPWPCLLRPPGRSARPRTWTILR